MKASEIAWCSLMWIFYYMTLFVSVYYITQVDWSNANAFQVIESCGVIGGLMYLGEFFRKDANQGKQE